MCERVVDLTNENKQTSCIKSEQTLFVNLMFDVCFIFQLQVKEMPLQSIEEVVDVSNMRIGHL